MLFGVYSTGKSKNLEWDSFIDSFSVFSKIEDVRFWKYTMDNFLFYRLT